MFKPKYHKIIKQWNHGRVNRFLLKYNTKMMEDANCAGLDSEFFFPPTDIFNREDRIQFARVCGPCPVQDVCLEWALIHERYGVWAATTPRDREKMRSSLNLMVSEPQFAERFTM